MGRGSLAGGFEVLDKTRVGKSGGRQFVSKQSDIDFRQLLGTVVVLDRIDGQQAYNECNKGKNRTCLLYTSDAADE